MSIHLVNRVPPETKMWLLHIGNPVADEAFFITGPSSNPQDGNKRRSMAMLAALISHPDEGLILFEVGAGKDDPEVWGHPLVDLFARGDYAEDQELYAAIAKTGNSITDVKAVIIGHLHLDHAGGLEHFRNTGEPVYCHELEIKNAFYSVATKTDLGLYLPTYLQFDINWQPFHSANLEFARSLTIHHCPGHTPGLCVLQVNLEKSGTWIFTSDQYITQEDYDTLTPQGWLTRDHISWSKSNQFIHNLQKLTNAKLILDMIRRFTLATSLLPRHTIEMSRRRR
ncbi:hypothetical protein VHEMI01012 [[Torrubiella] hemipterigena]|uniref:Metallo-beta-lactamase domain-containing protein n=1 Tax=[Torrubiella] hemipterigena TaxID=1531966 RepID=A0A0A1T3J7_9HYPO|nr:hypothetical protein VHEMI01012 [[Torrubiella] hemipterigena]